jgi:hypothetical protein
MLRCRRRSDYANARGRSCKHAGVTDVALRGEIDVAQADIERYAEHVPFQIDLRTFLLVKLMMFDEGTHGAGIERLAKVMAEFEPLIARIELEEAAETMFDDLPVYDPENGS